MAIYSKVIMRKVGSKEGHNLALVCSGNVFGILQTLFGFSGRLVGNRLTNLSRNGFPQGRWKTKMLNIGKNNH